jgi:cell division protein FtsQ
VNRIARLVGRKRRPPTRKQRLVRTLGAVGVLLAVLGISWAVFFSPWLVLRNVTVQGTSVLSAEEVETVAAAPLHRPLARVSERAVAERVVTLPAVDRVTVTRRWPSTLQIRVTERRPLFHVGEGAGAVLVDRVGATFRATPPDGVIEGHGPSDDPQLLAGVAAVVEAMPPELHDAAERVEFTSKDAITVRLAQNRVIFYGSAEQARTKGEVALALVQGTHAEHIDVSAPSRPSAR